MAPDSAAQLPVSLPRAHSHVRDDFVVESQEVVVVFAGQELDNVVWYPVRSA
jgi:hypothetical protein